MITGPPMVSFQNRPKGGGYFPIEQPQPKTIMAEPLLVDGKPPCQVETFSPSSVEPKATLPPWALPVGGLILLWLLYRGDK